jgi:predicted O-methyltransferase YrrM
VRLAQQEDARMRESWTAVRPELMRDLAVLPDRFALLERMQKGGEVAEIGVAAGEFAAAIHRITAPAKLHLIDAWNYPPMPDCSEPGLRNVRARFSDDISAGRVVIHRGLSAKMLAALPENSLDWVYVDAGHDYANASADLIQCARVVRPGGFIAGHDYLRWDSPLERYGVIEAVHEFVNAFKAEFRYLTIDYDPSFAVRLPE